MRKKIYSLFWYAIKNSTSGNLFEMSRKHRTSEEKTEGSKNISDPRIKSSFSTFPSIV